MNNRDPRVDTCIGKAAPFAKPILTRIRAAVHKGCPGPSGDDEVELSVLQQRRFPEPERAVLLECRHLE
jgi:hypothetical protein